jgi:uncharacterized membrane protein YfhO
LFPSLNEPYYSASEYSQMSQYPDILNDIIGARKAIFTADAWRSLIYVLLGAALVWLLAKKKLKPVVAVAVMAVLCLVDMYGVNKRYLNDEMFVVPEDINSVFQKSAADEQILQDKDLDYRVLNFTTNTFNENETSYFHKSIGGYSAVKLGRYQDLIDRHIANEMGAVINAFNDSHGNLAQVKGDSLFPVLNMLNDKYFIVSAGEGQKFAVQNPFAMGNGWFVGNIRYVDTPNQEIDALSAINLRAEAVADKKFQSVLGEGNAVADSSSRVVLIKYDANELDYEVESSVGGVVVFSEIYYPGWTATLDGQPLELGRVNYVLRAAKVPAGKHVVHMEYKPASVGVTETIAYVAIVVLLLVFVGAIVFTVRKKLKSQATTTNS